jgi:enoyl-CoA hydratase/carnithine racemase
MSDNEAVLTERRDRILLITINRPDQRNAVNAAVAQGIRRARRA